ncbi:LLM class flavin-dependent oxidoreductase, partial [Nonomuraea turkmeniaca]
VGGTPASAERAARLGLPMVLGLIGGDLRSARPLIEHYRAVDQAAGHAPEALRLGVTSHFYVGKTSQGVRRRALPLLPRVPAPQNPRRTRLAGQPRPVPGRLRPLRRADDRQPPGSHRQDPHRTRTVRHRPLHGTDRLRRHATAHGGRLHRPAGHRSRPRHPQGARPAGRTGSMTSATGMPILSPPLRPRSPPRPPDAFHQRSPLSRSTPP